MKASRVCYVVAKRPSISIVGIVIALIVLDQLLPFLVETAIMASVGVAIWLVGCLADHMAVKISRRNTAKRLGKR